MTIYYDAVNQRVRADISEGYEAGRMYIRRYDLKKEYMVEEGEFPECRRSYLGETMPPAVFVDDADPKTPVKVESSGADMIDGCPACERFSIHDAQSTVHVWWDADIGFPVRLTEEWMDKENATSSPLMTYELQNIRLGAPDAALFELPAPFTHKKCERHPGGFPYIHAFHWYLRF
jgi:hypothetical protein